MIRFVASMLLVTLFIGCDKDKECDLPLFSGIAWTNVNGEPMSNPDPDDWTIDDEWNDTEENLFDSDLETNCTPSFDYWISAYPNPIPDYNNSFFSLAIGKDSITAVELRIVDRLCNVIHSIDNNVAHNIAFNLQGHEGETLRLYYKFIKDGCEFRGHGDIQIE